ncbi:MAG: protein translocase subunit SecDF [Bacteroidales bacterium]|nr:protein translocase subunit SecDF [Bacteroidales bacterium]MDD4672588.1 protein translocase subunit SecDF [Bacteroidales bacterium]MDY0348774.1 protein translocase subunit SecDF [Tenuifilaceae bacterium]
MQNRGVIKLIAVLLTLVCLYHLSFTFYAKRTEKAAKEYAQGNPEKEASYLDSISSETVYNFMWLRQYTYREVKEREINLGLDLKGGMDVTLEVSTVDIIRSLSNNSTDSAFVAAIDMARKMPPSEDFITRFGKAFEIVAPDARLAAIFNTVDLRDRITFNSTNEEVLKVIRNQAESAISNSYNIIRNRIDRFGVAQSNIQRLEGSGRIVVQLPGIKDPERVRKLLQGTASLEFWETYENSEVFPALQEANKKVKEIKEAEEALSKADKLEVSSTEVDETLEAETLQADTTGSEEDELLEMLKSETDTTSFDQEDFAKENPLFAILNPSTNQQGQLMGGPVVGISHYRDTAQVNSYLNLPQVKQLLPRDLKLLWTEKAAAWDKTASIFELVAIKVTSRDGTPPLDGGAISDARDDFSSTGGEAEVSMSMNAEGAKIWARLTADNIGKSIAIVLDDYVYSFPKVNTEIKGGRSSITGGFSINEAKDLANVLKSGKLPAPARIMQEEIVGPSLGQEAIDSGLRSFMFSFIIVLLFMVFYYSHRGGLIADIALIANLFFMFGVLASFQATLTLPGIAGIVLTMGMSVDANVLIFERIREELKAGKGMNLAISDGYKNAYSAIIDGNVTTLLTGVILYLFGSGPIRGFATTLVIGIITSLFCALFLTRLIIHFMQKRKYNITFSNRISEGAFKGTKFNFIGSRKITYIISLAVILIAVGSLTIRGLNYGIDFTGGRTYVVRFQDDVSTVDIADELGEIFGQDPEVKTYGAANQVKITTKYKIDDDGANVDNEIDSLLHVGLTPFLPDNTSHKDYQDNFKQSSMKVGPTIAHDLKQEAFIALFFALLAIFLYILIRFKNWSYGMGSVLALSHDALIVVGVFSILYQRVPFSMEIDQAFIAAILTIIGYSINDSVVIFDRVREYIGLYPKRDRKETMNNALNDTLSRTFSTSFSTLVVLIPIFFFGGESIRGFIFGLIIGVLVGTYSSLFLASPIAYDINNWAAKRALAKAPVKGKGKSKGKVKSKR